ncbi:MAG: hypothetical protein ABIH34_01510 [Nanoarchaeota archaeon]
MDEEPLTDNERLEQGQLQCRVIIEVLGKPESHVKESISEYVKQLKASKDVTILEEEYADIKAQEELFSTFVELIMWVESEKALLGFCFDYMPSSIEIFKPATFHFKSNAFAGLLNDLQGRLHHMDMSVKTLSQQNKILSKNAKSLLRNLLILSIRQKPKDLNGLCLDVGLKPDKLEKFLKVYKSDGLVEEKEGIYHLKDG